jgi:adenylate cyclase
MYQERFEIVLRVARRITSSFEIGEIFEIIRDEAKVAVPQLQEVCLLVTEHDAHAYASPLPCNTGPEEKQCRLCDNGWPPEPGHEAGDTNAHCCSSPDENHTGQTSRDPKHALSELVVPIYDGDKRFAYLDATARQGATLTERDVIVLKDIAGMATNVIKRALQHGTVARRNDALARTLEQVMAFVPCNVRKAIVENPDSLNMEKRETDVTILFLDVADYTLISEIYSRERVNAILEKYFSAFLDAICRHGGYVNETAGDGLMAIFQGPSEESAINAVLTAREIRQITKELNDREWGAEHPIRVNVGVNSGPASVGITRFQGDSALRMTFTATGSTTNLAARLVKSAHNGDILIGSETARRIECRIPVYDREIMQFKNMREAVRVYSPLSEEPGYQLSPTSLSADRPMDRLNQVSAVQRHLL